MTEIPESERQGLFFCPSIFCDRFWLGVSPEGTLRLTFGEQGPQGPLVRVSVTLSWANGLEMAKIIRELMIQFEQQGGGKQ